MDPIVIAFLPFGMPSWNFYDNINNKILDSNLESWILDQDNQTDFELLRIKLEKFFPLLFKTRLKNLEFNNKSVPNFSAHIEDWLHNFSNSHLNKECMLYKENIKFSFRCLKKAEQIFIENHKLYNYYPSLINNFQSFQEDVLIKFNDKQVAQQIFQLVIHSFYIEIIICILLNKCKDIPFHVTIFTDELSKLLIQASQSFTYNLFQLNILKRRTSIYTIPEKINNKFLRKQLFFAKSGQTEFEELFL